MTIVSSKEFAIHPKKYFGMAMDTDVCIKRGRNMFHLTPEPVAAEQRIFEPDEDFYRSLSAAEFRERLAVVLERVDKKHAKKCG